MLTSSLYQPNLNCSNCYQIYSINKRAPACFKNACEIQDILESKDGIQIKNIVDAFITVEVLKEESGYSKYIENYLEKSGLNELEPEIIFKMKSIFRNYQNYIRSQKK